MFQFVLERQCAECRTIGKLVAAKIPLSPFVNTEVNEPVMFTNFYAISHVIFLKPLNDRPIRFFEHQSKE